ncbi:MAG: hypothetical protein L6Q73_05185 [Aquabacterium sp.]|nr:hypothetical protein [Aquabacterium sp.]
MRTMYAARMPRLVAAWRRALACVLATCGCAPACAGQTASTMWALNCMGCHAAPVGHVPAASGWRAQFAQAPSGRVFFMDVPPRGAVLSSDDDARLMREILTWKASCHVILQQAPSVRYTGLDHVK